MSGRHDISAVQGVPLRKTFIVHARSASGHRTRPDLSGLGLTFTIYDEGRETALATYSVAVGDDPTQPDPDRNHVLMVALSAADMDIAISTPALRRTIPMRRLPYTLTLEDAAGDQGEFLSGTIYLKGKIT